MTKRPHNLKYLTLLLLVLIQIAPSLSSVEENKDPIDENGNIIPPPPLEPEEVFEVPDLMAEDFEETILSKDGALVMFQVPNGHGTTKYMRSFHQAIPKVEDLARNIGFYTVNVLKNDELTKSFKLSIFPKILFFKKDLKTAMLYQGRADADYLVHWMLKKVNDPTLHIDDLTSLDQIRKSHVTSIAYFGSDSDEEYKIFKNTAPSHQDVHFFYSSTPALIEKFGAKSIVLFTSHDISEIPLPLKEGHKLTEEDILNHIRIHEHEVVMHFQDDTIIERIFERNQPAIVLFTDEESSSLRDIFERVGGQDRQFVDQHIIFTESRITSGDGERLAEYVGVSSEMDPSIMIFQHSEKDFEKYIFDRTEQITEESLKKYLSDWRAGKLRRFYRSEDLDRTEEMEKKSEEKIEREGISRLNSEMYEDAVMAPGRSSLVVFELPYAAACRDMLKVLEKANKLVQKEVNNFDFFRVDASRNDVHGHIYRGYPTVLVYVNGRKEKPFRYHGKEVAKEVFNFILEKMTEVEGVDL